MLFGDRFAQYEIVDTPETCHAPPIPPPQRPTDIVIRDIESGAVLWRASEPLDDRLPTVGAGHLVVGAHLVAGYDLDGCGAATCPPSWTGSGGSVGSPPLVAGDHVFVSRPGQIEALDAATGTTAWEGPTGTFPGYLVFADGIVYTSAGGRLFAFDASGCGAPSCDPLWDVPIPHSTESFGWTLRAAAGGLLYLAGFGPVAGTDGLGRLIALDPIECSDGSCSPLWDTGVFTGRPERISVSDGMVFVQVHRDGDRSDLRDLLVAYSPSD